MIIYKSDGVALIHIKVDDASYRYREIMGDSKVYLEFALTQYVDIEIGSYVDFQGERYMLMAVADVTIQHNRDYEYKVTFEGPQARFSKYRVHNPVDGRLVFEMTAYPQEHLAVIISNLNEREGAEVWSAGACITGAQKTMSYNHTKLNDALTALANLYDTEWEVTAQKQIHLNKLEYNAGAPLALAYGRNAGFKPGVGRTNYGELGQIERVYIQGGDRNISLKEYGSKTLLLPKDLAFKFDGEKFRYYDGVNLIEESGFNASKAVDMITDGHGYSVMLASAGAACNEESLDLTDIYPKRVGYVTDVRYLYDHQYLTYAEIAALGLTEEEWLKVQVDIIDSGISADLDYAQYLLANDEPLTVIFQDGMLGGREFSATFCKEPRMAVVTDPETGVETEVEQRPGNRFELVRGNFNGIEMPNATFRPNAATGATQDTYIVVNCYLPDEYICDKAHASGAEFDALRQAAKFLYANKDIQLTFKGEIDDLYSKRNWLNVGGKLVLGGCISFTHAQVQKEALVTRIVAIKDYINNPYSPEVTLSNESVKGGLTSRLSQMKGESAHVLNQAYALERYARRSFRDAKETMAMLENALLEGFTERISPIAVQTMQLLLGDESLQFRYVNAKVNPVQVSPGINYDPSTKKLVCNAGIIQHMTLGIDTLSNTHADSEYKFWDIASFESPYLGDALSDKKYYLYAKCNKAEEGEEGYQEAEYVLSETAIAMNSVEGYYHLLVGILNSESEGDRSFVALFGFTEVLPGRITTDKIVSGAGTTYWDLVQNILQMGDKLHFDPVNGLILNTPLVQTGSGDPVVIGAWCGEYSAARTYKLGDEVWWQAPDGTVSTYRYINAVPASGHAPSDDNYWQFVAKGVKGTTGMNTAVVYLYKRSASQPSINWTNDLVYNFANKALTSVPSGWSASIPANNGLPLYVTAATAASREETDTIAYTEWATPVEMAEDGADGLNSATVVLYKRAASAPSKPTATLTYTFATGVLSGSLSGWTQAMPATNGNPCYRIQATAISTGTTDTIAASEWSAVVKVLEDGSDGDDGNDGNGIASITEAYARSLNGSTPPSSWSSTKYSPLAGYYNWTRTTIKFTDTSKSDFVSYQAVYCAEDGDNGDPGPSSPYQGEYDGNTTYYATSKRCDVVYYPTTAKWYQALYNGTDRSFAGKLPTNTAYWSDYGANFSNIATGLVLAVKAIIKNAIIEQLTTSSESGAYLSAQGNSMAMYDDSGNQRLLIIGSDLGDTPDDLNYNVLATTAINKSFTAEQVNAGQEVTDAGVVSLYKSGTVTTFTVEDDACSVKIADVELWVRINNSAAVSGDSDITWQGSVYLAIDGEIMATSAKGFSLSINDTADTTLILKGWNVQVPAGTHTLKLVTQGFISGHGLNSGNCRFMMTVPAITSGLIVAYPSQVTAIGANGFRAMFSGSQKAEFLNDNGTVTFIIRNGNYGMRWTGSALQFTFNGGSTWYSASYGYNSTLGSGYLKLS